MLLIASALAVLVIFAGMKLLAQTKKDALGNTFKYMSWFIVVMGFLMLICVGAHGMMRHFHRGDGMMMRCEMGGGYGHKMMGRMNSCHDGMMRGGCSDGMMNSSCCGGMKDGCCGGMMNGKCDDGMGASCGGNMKESCPMNGNMKGCTMEKKDSVAVKKK